jgi:hypothetical protein
MNCAILLNSHLPSKTLFANLKLNVYIEACSFLNIIKMPSDTSKTLYQGESVQKMYYLVLITN